MKTFILNFHLDNLKKKFFLIYLLNITDILFTLWLLNTGYFIEANPLMEKVVKNNWYSFLIKGILPAIMLVIICIRMRKANKEQLKISNYFINGIGVAYLLINIMHMFCISLLL